MRITKDITLMIFPAAPKKKMPISLTEADELIEYESTLDTIVECGHVHKVSPKAYKLFRKALSRLAKDCEKVGIYGKWQSEIK